MIETSAEALAEDFAKWQAAKTPLYKVSDVIRRAIGITSGEGYPVVLYSVSAWKAVPGAAAWLETLPWEHSVLV